MTLESLVPSLALCQQLKAAGFPQDTVFKWCRFTRESDIAETGHEYSVSKSFEDYYCPAEEVCAAPTAEEILKELPLFLNKAINEQLCVTREESTLACNGWLVGWWSMNIHGALGGIGERSLSNVAAQSYLWWKKEVAG
jgi:hypothetical protein